MASWRLTKSLARFRRLVDERWPNRDHASDGTIGNAAHQAETSSHNADDTPGSQPEWNSDPDSIPEVRAFDMDSDLREPGTTAQMLVDHLIRLPGLSSVFRYIIYNRKIYRAADGWKPETYTGPSPHTEHIHFSGAYSQAADDNETFDFRLDEVGNVAFSKDDLGVMAHSDGVFKAPAGASPNSDGTPNTHWTLETYIASIYATAVSARTYAAEAKDRASRIETKQAALDAKLTAVSNSLLAAITALAAKDVVDEQALASALTPGLAAAVVATLPPGPLTAEEAKDAVLSALREAFAGTTPTQA